MLNVLCLREHNRLCDVLAQALSGVGRRAPLPDGAQHPHRADLESRRRGVHQPHRARIEFKFIADPLAFPNERWYRQNWMAVEFTLVYRWHSALPPTATYAGTTMPMWDTFWNNALVTERGLGVMFEETSAQAAGRIGLHNTDDVLVDAAEKRGIQLGRDAQVASYNDYRAMCGFPRVTTFAQITGDVDTQRELRAALRQRRQHRALHRPVRGGRAPELRAAGARRPDRRDRRVLAGADEPAAGAEHLQRGDVLAGRAGRS